MQQPESRRVDVGPVLRIVEWAPPDGAAEYPAIVAVHGLASNALLWRGAAEELVALGHRTVAVDQRGHGRSDKPDGGYDMATVAADLARLLESLRDDGINRPVLAGQSWGGNVVVELAHDRPDLVRGIVAVDGGFIRLRDHFTGWEACAEALRPPPIAGTPASDLRGWMRRSHPDWPESGIDGTMENMEHLDDGTVRPWLTLERHMAILRGLWEHDPIERLGATEVPVLFVPAVGDGPRSDRTRDAAMRAAAAAPCARIEWFEGADHDLHAQMPARFARTVHDAVVSGFFA